MRKKWIPKCIYTIPCGIHKNMTSLHHSCGEIKPRTKIIITAEQRKKISDTFKIKKIKPPSRTGMTPWNKGLKGFRAKEKSHLWKGGKQSMKDMIRTSFEYRQWRSDVFLRDKYTCVWCGQIRGLINADHIKPFSVILDEYKISSIEEAINCAELWNINNGRTLCVKCHTKTESYPKAFKKRYG